MDTNENSHEIQPLIEGEMEEVNVDLLNSIKNFMDDLSSATESKNFKDYHTIVNHIDQTKIKSYLKLIKGFKNFFDINSNVLAEGNFNGLIEPNISFVTGNGSFIFDFQKIFQEAEEGDQDIIKDHLNHIWDLLNNTDKSPEELYIDKIFKDLKSKLSADLSGKEQMIAKDLFDDFQKQDLDISIVVKVACRKAREMLTTNGSDDHSKTLTLIDAVEDIDVNNFNMVQFIALVGKVGTLFANGESNPLSGILSSIFTDYSLPIGNLNLKDEEDH